MKLLRHGLPGQERPGLLDSGGGIRDLSGVIGDIDPECLRPEALASLRALDPEQLPRVDGQPRLGPPVAGVSKFIAIGLNYHDHAREANLPVPTEPVIFPKWTSCLCGANDPIVPPPDSSKLDWEVELAIVIGRRARGITEAEALAHVAGYSVANDVSERAYQLERSGGQWGKGKGFDSFGPVGPYLVTADEVPDPQNLHLWLKVNGELMQIGNSRHMIFSCAFLVAYCSRIMTLEAGDIIITGTPPGVGMGRKPPRYLKPGDVVELGIDGLGSQRQVVAYPTAG
jgi:2-keto-4-pentenoate hydratase/2-oxohepta-3-ene-1,7-dioic acid hydratase in catechol pathway